MREQARLKGVAADAFAQREISSSSQLGGGCKAGFGGEGEMCA